MVEGTYTPELRHHGLPRDDGGDGRSGIRAGTSRCGRRPRSRSSTSGTSPRPSGSRATAIRVIQPPVGGNFGRGLDLYPIDIIAALLARHVRRPVKIVFDREEEFLASPTREPCVFTLRTAARADGTLLARDARVLIDNGAYVSWGSTTPYVMMTTLAGFYRCPNIRFDTAIVYTNNVYSGSMRGYGNLESTFAVEAQMDDLAERLGLDRLEIRRRNANRPGDVTPAGPPDHELRADRVLRRGRARHPAARRAAAPPGLAAGHRLRRDVPRGRRGARVPLRRLRGHRQARRLREGHADHRAPARSGRGRRRSWP